MFSIVIPTRNRPELLNMALCSLWQQTYKDFEVVLVNDGGLTITPVVERWQNKLTMKVIELPTNCGVAKARNVALLHCSGEYVAFLDDDDAFLPNHLEVLNSEFAAGKADLLYTSAAVLPHRYNHQEIGSYKYAKDYAFDDQFLLVANYIHTGSVAVKNIKLGTEFRFDESLTHCEDWDMWLRLTHEAKFRASHINFLTAVYHQTVDSDGLVAKGQQLVPSPFRVAREYIQNRWQTTNDLVGEYRRWFDDFEVYRDYRITNGLPIPHQLFDSILMCLYPRFISSGSPRSVSFAQFFDD